MKRFHIFVLLIFFISCKTTKRISPDIPNDFISAIEDHRKEYKEEFLKDERSPLQKEDLQYLRFFEPDAQYVCACSFIATPESKPFEMATYSGDTRAYKKYGTATCTIGAESFPINIYQNLTLLNVPGYKDYLFIPFKDHTNGVATYGGGRYMDIRSSDITDGTLMLDFNKCYNPWCAYSDGYSCPIPPAENHLTFEILAGEKLWMGEKKGGH